MYFSNDVKQKCILSSLKHPNELYHCRSYRIEIINQCWFTTEVMYCSVDDKWCYCGEVNSFTLIIQLQEKSNTQSLCRHSCTIQLVLFFWSSCDILVTCDKSNKNMGVRFGQSFFFTWRSSWSLLVSLHDAQIQWLMWQGLQSWQGEGEKERLLLRSGQEIH